jgi:hypothetical protein
MLEHQWEHIVLRLGRNYRLGWLSSIALHLCSLFAVLQYRLGHRLSSFFVYFLSPSRHIPGLNQATTNSFRILSNSCVKFEVLAAVFMKSTIFWDITPCSPLRVNRPFGGTYCHHLQGRKNKTSKKPALLATCFHGDFFIGLFSRPWWWRRYVSPKRPLTLNGLDGVIASVF